MSYGDWSPPPKVELCRFNTEISRRMMPSVQRVGELMNRATFRSTQLALLVLAEAIEKPGKAIPVVDHQGTTHANRMLLDKVRVIANALDFGRDWEFNASQCTVTNKAVEVHYG